MSVNVWDEDEFRDNVVEHVDGQWQDSQVVPQEMLQQTKSMQHSQIAQQSKPTKKISPDFSQVDEMVEEIQDENDDSDDFSMVLNDARLRLAQGQLYEMVMNHNIFDGLEADPAAIKNVQKEIRKFAKERMEIMLGMRQEKSIENVVNISSPFNDLEVDLLKQLTFKMSQGKTAESVEEEPIQVVQQRKTGLNTIGSSRPTQKMNKPQALKKSPEPLRRTKVSVPVQQILAEEGVSREELEENYIPLTKKIEELSPKEQAERIRQTQERLSKNKRADNPNKVPMPSYEQQEMMASSLASRAATNPLMGRILQNLNNKVSK